MTLKQRWHDGKAQLAQVNWYLCSGIAFLLLVVLSFVLAGWKLNLLLNDAQALPIEAVAIKGERQYTSDNDIRLALQDLMKRSFFQCRCHASAAGIGKSAMGVPGISAA